jgi:hypothetical protein
MLYYLCSDEKPREIKANIEDVEENPVEKNDEADIGGSPPWGNEGRATAHWVEAYEINNQAVCNS